MLLGALSPTITPARAGDDVDYLVQIVDAARASDEDRLTRLAAAPENDPWLAVDRLAEAGLLKAVRIFARELRAPDAAAVRAYVDDFPLDDGELRARVDRGAAKLAREQWQAALEMLAPETEIAPCVSTVRRWINLGRAHAGLDDAPASLQACDRAIREAQALGWLRGEFAAWHGRFWALRLASRYEDALEAVGERRRLAARLDDERLGAYVDREQARLHIDLREYWSAVPLLERAIGVFERVGPRRVLGESLALLGLAHGKIGNYAPALTAIEHATRIAREVGDVKRYVDARYTESGIRLDMGFYAHAIAIAEELLARSALEAIARAQLLANRAMAHAYLENEEDADRDFATAIELAADADEVEWRRWFLMMRALTLHCTVGAWEDAERDALAATDPEDEIQETNGWALLAFGVALIGQERNAEAEATFDRVLRIADVMDILDLRMSARARKAELAMAGGKPRAAVDWSRKALADLDLIAAGLADDEGVTLRKDAERARIFRTWRLAALALPAKERASALFEASEAGRARLLLAAMGGTHRARGLGLPDALRDREREAQRALLLTREAYQRQLARQRSPDRIKEARIALETARRRWQDTVASIQRQSGARGALAYPPPARLEDLQVTLRDDEAVAVYMQLDGAGHALVVTKDAARLRAIAAWDEAEAAVGRMLARGAREAPDQHASDIALLDKALLDALDLGSAVRSLYIVPEGFLTAVPWPRLTAPRLDRAAMLPSAMMLPALRARRPVSSGRRLLLADPRYEREARGRSLRWGGRPGLAPLDHSGDEIAGLARKGDVFLTRRQSSETRVKQELSKPHDWDLIHLACHGRVHAVEPSLTSLALSPVGDEDDGFLTATEVFGLHARTRLVVLSACDVGRATYAEGVGVLGLVRAFMAAGAPVILASVRPVDNAATTKLMQFFHQERAKGKDVHAALHAAQLRVRNHRDARSRPHWADEHYWASWVIWGLNTDS